MLDPMMDVKQVAELMGISQNHARRLAGKRDGIPSYKIGRSLRFKREEVEQYIEAQKVEPPEKAQPFVQGHFRYTPGMKVV